MYAKDMKRVVSIIPNKNMNVAIHVHLQRRGHCIINKKKKN
jgi:hypothetical protein